MFNTVKGLGYTASASLTRANDTTAYSVGDVIGTSTSGNLTFLSCSTIDGGHIIIAGVSLEIDVNAIPSGMGLFRLHLYDSAPTAIADNAAYNLPSGDRSKYLGYIEIDTPVDLGDTLYSAMNNVTMKRQLASGSNTLYGMLETRGAYTPSAQAVKKVTLHIVGV